MKLKNHVRSRTGRIGQGSLLYHAVSAIEQFQDHILGNINLFRRIERSVDPVLLHTREEDISSSLDPALKYSMIILILKVQELPGEFLRPFLVTQA